MISKRAQSIDTSGIRRIFNLIAGMKDPIDLSIGQPAFDAFDEMKTAVQQAMEQGKSRYTVTQGMEELRAGIRKKRGIAPDEKNFDVIVSSGVSSAFMLSYMAILDPGDEVLIPDPFFGMYRDVAKLLNAEPKYYETYPTFHLPLEKMESLITPKTRAIVVNNPGNPTGVALTEAELTGLIDIAKKHRLWIVYDEVYSFFTFDYPHVDLLRRYDMAVVLNGFGKSHGIPGWRLGYAVGNSQIIGEMIKMQQYTIICAPSLVQWAGLAALEVDASYIVDEYRGKRDFLYDSLKDVLRMEKPTGAFYAFPEAPGGSGQKFVEKCIQNNLLIVPGNAFSNRDTHFRISFSTSMETLERGVELLVKMAKTF